MDGLGALNEAINDNPRGKFFYIFWKWERLDKKYSLLNAVVEHYCNLGE
jgi:hypothetical protein